MDDLDDQVGDESKVSGKFLEGTLYFMQETDYLSGAKFDYYKIGIVKGNRDVFEREKDHKTGNPRKIESIRDLQSPAVQLLETYLHNTLAKHRVSSGEWFYLPGELLSKAIASAEEIRDSLLSNIDGLLLEAGKSKSNHSGQSLPAQQELIDLAAETQNAELAAKLATERRKAIAERLKEVASHDDSFSFLFKVSSVDEKTSFDTTSFSKAHKEMYELYKTKQSSSWSMKFLVQEVSAPELPKIDFENLTPFQIHEAYLEAWSEQEQRVFEHSILEAKLLSAVGDACAVEGIVEWKESKRVAFDSAKFKSDHPELVSEFVKVTPAKVNKTAAEWASYSRI